MLGAPSIVAGKILGGSGEEGRRNSSETINQMQKMVLLLNSIWFIFFSYYSPLYIEKMLQNRSRYYSKISFKMVTVFAIV